MQIRLFPSFVALLAVSSVNVAHSQQAATADASAEHASAEHASAEKGEWRSLFNGKDLSGWTPKIRFHKSGENHADTFRVEDGLLKVGYDNYAQFDNHFGHLFFNETFSHYRFRAEYRFVGEQVHDGPGWAKRNSGIMIHGQSPESMGVDQDFPVSIEVQLLGGYGKKKRTTGNLCSPGTNVVMGDDLFTRHCTSSSSETYHGEQWVTVEIEVHGSGVIKHIINGDVVLEYKNPQLDPRDQNAAALIEQAGGEVLLSGGTISLQSESHPVEFRKVEIMVLDPAES